MAGPARGAALGAALAVAGVLGSVQSCELYQGRSLDLFPGVTTDVVECHAATDCPRERAQCARGACVECLLDADCGPGQPACVGNRCVECRSAEHCASNQSCNGILNLCSLSCVEPSDCAGQPATHCSGELDVCVQCTADV